MKFLLRKPPEISQEEYKEALLSLQEKGLVSISANGEIAQLTDLGIAVAENEESTIPLSQRN